MTWGPRARRRADDFAALVERSATGASIGPDARDADLLELVGALRAAPDPAPRPEFVAELRSRLLAEAETALVPDELDKLRLPARRTPRERRIAVLVGGLAIAGATTSVALTAQSALPGESLYPIKRVIESAHTGLSVGDARKGGTELANASSRLDEVTALTRGEDLGDDERIADTLSTFTDQASAGADLLLADHASSGKASSIATLRDFASGSMDRLSDLEPQIPGVARDELLAAARTLAEIDAEAERECATCGGTPISSIPLPFAAEIIDLPTPGSSRPQGEPGDRQGQGDERGGGDQAPPRSDDDATDDPALPDVEDALPPGSVPDPATPTPSTTATATRSPLQDLTDPITGVLTGKDPSGSRTPTPESGPTSSQAPLSEVLGGVGDLLEGVLDPITGPLLPGVRPTP